MGCSGSKDGPKPSPSAAQNTKPQSQPTTTTTTAAAAAAAPSNQKASGSSLAAPAAQGRADERDPPKESSASRTSTTTAAPPPPPVTIPSGDDTQQTSSSSAAPESQVTPRNSSVHPNAAEGAASPPRPVVDDDVDVTDVSYTPSMRSLQGVQLWSAAANRYPESAKALYKAAMALEGEERLLHLSRFPRGLNKTEALIEATRLHRELAAPYIALGNGLRHKDDTITLADGSVVNRQQCYALAVNYAPGNAVAWYSLGNAVASDETIAVAGKPAVGKLDCFAQSIFLDTKFAAPLKVALHYVTPTRSVMLPNGQRLTKKDLLVRLAVVEPSAKVFFSLSEMLGQKDCLDLSEKDVHVTKKNLLARAIAKDDKFLPAYHALMPLLAADEVATTGAPSSLVADEEEQEKQEGGKSAKKKKESSSSSSSTVAIAITKRDCCVKIIELDRENPGVAYATLSRLMAPNDDEVQLCDGRSLTKRTASLAAVKAQPWAAREKNSKGDGSPQDGAADVANDRMSSEDDGDEAELVEPYEA